MSGLKLALSGELTEDSRSEGPAHSGTMTDADLASLLSIDPEKEARTFQRFRAGRNELLEPEIRKHHGRRRWQCSASSLVLFPQLRTGAAIVRHILSYLGKF